MQTVGSEPLSISPYDWKKVGKGALIGGSGSLLFAILSWLLEAVTNGKIDLGPYALYLIPLISTLVNAALKWLQNTEQTVSSVKLLTALFAAMLLASPAKSEACGPLCRIAGRAVGRVVSLRPGILIPKRSQSPARYHAPDPRCCGAPSGSCYCAPQNGGCRCDYSCPCGPPLDAKAYRVRISIKGSDGKQLGEIDPKTGQVIWEISQRAAESATVTVVMMQGCRPCAKLKEAFQQSEDLRSYKPLFVDMRECKELRTLRITSFPTLLVRTPDKAVIYRKSGFDGNAKKLADEMAAAIKRHRPPQRRPAVRIGRRMANDPRFQVFVG